MRNNKSKQGERMLQALQASAMPLSAAALSRIGSGKPDGWTASFTKRISELRSRGFEVRKVVDLRVDGQRHTSYQLFTDGQPHKPATQPN